jgi:EAL domain-containing protein (putative c-di-GMP-specific phosphodiesterase class I)
MQPIVSVPTGRIAGVEALARFPSAPGASPRRWFARAEVAGTARQLELAAVERALEAWHREPIGDYVAVNVSVLTLLDPALLTLVLAGEVPYGGVVVEITEHSTVDDDAATLAAIERLRAAGARVALDDVGAGFTSLDVVRRLRPDILKIDGGLVAGLRSAHGRHVLVRAAARLARDIGASLTFEGIETGGDLAAARAYGADEVQGYHLARPTADRRAWRAWAAAARENVATS